MEQDINKIMDILGAEWANDAVTLRKRIAILTEEIGRLKQENEHLKYESEKENAE